MNTENFPARARGLVRSNASASEANRLLAELQTGFESFKAARSMELQKLHAGIDDLAGQIAVNRLGGGGTDSHVGRHAADMNAFKEYMRLGQPQAGMRESNDPSGGYAVPEGVDRVVQNMLVPVSPMRNWANVVTLGQGSGLYSFLVNRRGFQSGWVGEEDSRPETATGTLGKVIPPEGEIYANASVSQWLLDDSFFDMAAFIDENIIAEFATQEGAAFVNGDGIKKPAGFLNNAKSAALDESRAFGTLQYVPSGNASGFTAGNPSDALISMVYALKAPYRAGNRVGWLMNSMTASVVRKFKDSQGNYLWADSLVMGQPSMLLGYPVAIDENMPDIAANAYPVAFGNWLAGYRIVDRLGTRALRDPFTNKPMVMFYFTKRVSGAVADSRAIKLLKIAVN